MQGYKVKDENDFKDKDNLKLRYEDYIKIKKTSENAKMNDILQKGGRGLGLGQIYSF